jgi:glycerophosphoryl diester phosphodiesterase
MLDRGAFLRPIAHRGLHDAARGIIENTAPAFEAAIAKGYGIECDLRPAAGGLPIVLHDKTLDRLVDGRGPVAALTPADIKRLRYAGGAGVPILTFSELLDLVRGRVPLLVEVKSEWAPPDPDFLGEVARIALAYQGPVALMSFDPDVMVMLRALAPSVPRGIVSGSYRYEDGTRWWGDEIGAGRAWRLANLLESFPARPSFIAYDVRALPAPATRFVRGSLGLPLFTWTVRTEEQRRVAARLADAPIFEGYEA